MWPWRSPWPLGSRARSRHILSLLFDLSIHTSVNSWLSHFKFSIVVVEKRSSGWSGITSSIYLNLNISVIYCRFEIKLILVKAEWRWLLFRKKTFLRHFRSRIHDVIKLSTADISVIFGQIASQFGQRDLGGPYDFEVI